MSNTIGIDLGGTKIHLVKYSTDKWKKSDEILLETKADQGFDKVLKQLVELIKHYGDKETMAIGIGVPGPTLHGIVDHFPNIPGAKHTDLKSQLEKKTGLPIIIENDANCFLVGAWQEKAYRELNNLIGLTFGTGVGGAIIANGKLERGHNGAAGEFGHMILRDKQRVEDLLSGTALENGWRSYYNDEKSGQEIVQLAKNGDKEAMEFLRNVGEDVGLLLANLIHAFNPEAILIGGSAAAALPTYHKSIQKVFKEQDFPATADIPIKHIKDPVAACFGAAWLATIQSTDKI